jgi:flagellar FliL protein
MSMATDTAGAPETDAVAPKKRRRALPIALAAALLVVAGGLGAAYLFIPAFSTTVHDVLAHKEPSTSAVSVGPVFADLSEMSLTLTNGGQARQLRIRISVELAPTARQLPSSEVLSPKVYDALLTYLRTLTDAEVENSLAIDRIRGDIFRRLTLLRGPNIVRDVLITSLVIA